MTEIFKTLPLYSLANWDIRNYFAKTQIVSRFPLCTVNSFMHRVKENITVQDTEQYKRVTIKTNGAGACLRDIVKGKNINTKKQFVVHTNQFLISKIDARNGAFGIVRGDIEGAIITGNFWAYDVDETVVLKEYLLLLLSCKRFQDVWKDCSNGSGNRLYLDEAKFYEYKLPIPPISQQRKILDEYYKLIKKADECTQKNQNIAITIENYLYEMLGIGKKQFTKQKVGKLGLLSFRNLYGRWEINRTSEFIDISYANCKYPVKNLGDVVNFVKRNWSKHDCKTPKINYIEIGGVNPDNNVVLATELFAKDAPSRASQYVKTDDLIIGMTRPNLKKFALISKEQNKNICSSGFQVIEASQNYVSGYILELLKTDVVMAQFESLVTGALYPAITSDMLAKVKIPIPPINVQEKISEEIKSMKEIIAKNMLNAVMFKQKAVEYFEKTVFVK